MAGKICESSKTVSQLRAEELRQAWLCPSPRQAQSSYVRVRRLPPGVTTSELLAFFRGYGTVPSDIRFFPGSSEECLLQLPSVSHAQNLLVERGQFVLFGCSLELTPATEDESRALGFLLHARELLQGNADRPSCHFEPGPNQATATGVTEIPPALDTPAVPRKISRSHSPRPQSPFPAGGAHRQSESTQKRASSPARLNSASSVYEVAQDGSHSTLGNREQLERASASRKAKSPPRIQTASRSEVSKHGGSSEARTRSTSSTTAQHTRAVSPLPSTPRGLVPSVSPSGYFGKHKSSQPSPGLGRPPPLPHGSLHHEKARVPTLRRAESAPPAVLGDFPVPAQYWEYSARDWNIAVSSHKMECLRQHLTSVQCEIAALRSSFDKDASCCNNLEEQIEAGRMRMRELRDEETATMNAEYAGKFQQAEVELECDAEIVALRYRTELLASEVENAAKLQLTRSESLNDMRIAAKLARARQDVKASLAQCSKLKVNQREQEAEIDKALDAVQKLRARMEELEGGASQMRNEESTVRSLAADREAAQHEEMVALRLEVDQAGHAKQLASNTLAAQHQVHEARRMNVSDLNLRLAETRVATQRFAKKLQEIGSQGSSLTLKLEEFQAKTKAINFQVGAGKVACDMLLEELQQQRDATMAWQACEKDLALGQLAISKETARVVNASREALCSMAAGIDEARGWSNASLPMPTR